MSDPTAIAAVTATLRNLVTTGLHADTALNDGVVTTMPLDQARQSEHSKPSQVNLFLYGTEANAGWRNADPPGTPPNEGAQPPLALDLRYLLTVWGRGDDDVLAHRALGRAMRVLHDHPLLGRAELETAYPDSDVSTQVERIRIRPHPIGMDEMSKLWTAFQTHYRTSTAYEVSVLLIDSLQPTRSSLPVLTVGPRDDPGVDVRPDLLPPFPTLLAATPPPGRDAVRIGETLTLTGHDLAGASVEATFSNFRLAQANVVPVGAVTDPARVDVEIPDDPAGWVAGVYTVSLTVSRAGEPDRTTNELPFALAPLVSSISPSPAARDGSGDVTLTLDVGPGVRPEQRASLLIAGTEVQPQPFAAPAQTLAFRVTGAPAGTQYVRLRVDGVDSVLVDRSTEPPSFDPTQAVELT